VDVRVWSDATPILATRDALGLVVVGNLALSDGSLVRVHPEGSVPATRSTTEVAGTHQFFGPDDPNAPRRDADPHTVHVRARIHSSRDALFTEA